MGRAQRKFDVGSKVMAKWPKTTLYYTGTVIDYNDVEYLVRFQDEDEEPEYPVKYSDVTAPFQKSRSRSRSRGRTPPRSQKSPSRRKSPGRPPAGSKSPSRTAIKSPARTTLKSPSRSTKSPKSSEKETEIKTLKVEENKDISKTNLRTRQSARIANIEKKLIDDKPNLKVNTESIKREVEFLHTFQGYIFRFFKALWETAKPLPLLAFTIIVPVAFIQMCVKNKCSLEQYEALLTGFSSSWLKSCSDLKSYGIVFGFFLLQLILAFIPFGKVIKLPNGAKYRCNGIVSFLVTASIIPVFYYFNYDIGKFYRTTREFLVASVVLGFFLGISFYIKSLFASKRSLNPKRVNYLIPDMIYGNEISPRFKNIDFKLFIIRNAFMSWIFLNALIVIKSWADKGPLSVPLLVIVSMQIFYALDFLWFEDCVSTSYEYSKRGVGIYFNVETLTFPFVVNFLSRFVYNHGYKQLPWYYLLGASAVYILGYIILRGANSQKLLFKTNPSNPALAHLETLSTSGSRLLISGFWGFVRHPNYLGDFLIQLSYCLICGFNFALPWIFLGFSGLYLIFRTFMVEKDCKKKYGLAWSTYTSKVKSRLIPYVF